MKTKIIQILKKAYHTAHNARFHRAHMRTANNILKVVEKYLGKPEEKYLREARQYAHEVLRSDYYAPWLYVYTTFSGKFNQGWIPPNYYHTQVLPRIKGPYGRLSWLRPMTEKLMAIDCFPDLGYIINDQYLTRGYKVVSEKDFIDAIFSNGNKVIFKGDLSRRGESIAIWTRESFDKEALRHAGNGTVQTFLRQHPILAQLSPTSVATLRLTTVIAQNGKASLRAAYLRIGRNSDSYVKSASHIRIPVDLKTGELGNVGYLVDWSAVKSHPDTHLEFSGMAVPQFEQCVQTVLDLQESIPFVHCVGWDITVDEQNNVQIMEWNGNHNDIRFSEATQGPCFGDLNWERFAE
jgi:hypothetical protein